MGKIVFISLVDGSRGGGSCAAKAKEAQETPNGGGRSYGLEASRRKEESGLPIFSNIKNVKEGAGGDDTRKWQEVPLLQASSSGRTERGGERNKDGLAGEV